MKCYLIKFTAYVHYESDQIFNNEVRLIYAKDFNEAVKKLKSTFNASVTIKNVVNLTIE